MTEIKLEYRTFDKIVDRKLDKMDVDGVGEFEIGIYECLVEFLSIYKFDSKLYIKSKEKLETHLDSLKNEIKTGGDFNIGKCSNIIDIIDIIDIIEPSKN
jgi:hypothetical protein